jgi:tRNA-dihydrouridine synthase
LNAGVVFDECTIRGQRFAPARFCAPLAGYTHSAFRRLLAEFGGCGALWTEMLAARQILKEDFHESPWLKRRPEEGRVVFQLMACEGDPLDRILAKLGEHGVEAVDLNLACDALSIRAQSAGSALWENFDALRWVVQETRRHWPGIMTTKIRLGSRRPDWEPRFVERLRLLEQTGVDAVIVHTRHFEDKFRRRARHELIPWVASLTRLPLIANGDLGGPEQAQLPHLQPASAIMIGRLAVACPWVFAAWSRPLQLDHAAVWLRMFAYIAEDFAPATAVSRIKMFTKYFAANFAFGHSFYHDVAKAESLEAIRDRALAFLNRNPAILTHPTVAGL